MQIPHGGMLLSSVADQAAYKAVMPQRRKKYLTVNIALIRPYQSMNSLQTAGSNYCFCCIMTVSGAWKK